MYQLIHLQINKQVLPLFNFLKDNPTRTIAKRQSCHDDLLPTTRFFI